MVNMSNRFIHQAVKWLEAFLKALKIEITLEVSEATLYR